MPEELLILLLLKIVGQVDVVVGDLLDLVEALPLIILRDFVILEKLLQVAASQGAWGGKACGAGGGGSLAILCPPERRSDIAAALQREGGEILSARPVPSGCGLAV